MKPKMEDEPQPELEELLQKPNSFPLLADRRKHAAIVPSRESTREKSHPDDAAGADVVTAAIGDCGRWQFTIVFLLSLFSFPCTFHIYLPTFTARGTKFWCSRPDNLSNLPIETWINYSQPVDACNVRVLPDGIDVETILNFTAPVLETFEKCTSWEYDRTEVGNTIISEWNLVCDRAGLTNLAEVVFLVGVGVGGVVGGWISDKFGRKKILMSMMIAQSALALLSLLVRSYTQYVIVRLLMGLVSVSVVYAAFVLAVELVGGKWVTIAGVCNFFPLPISYVIVSLLSLALPDWRDLQLSVSLPGCLLLLLWFVLPESPRWLISMGKTKEAKVVLQRAAKFNHREFPPDFDKLLMLQKTATPDETSGVSLLFKPPLLKRTICLFIVWFAMTIGYYGLLLNIGNFNLGDLHLASIILAVVEIPAIALSIPVLLKAGRRVPIFISMLACGLACVASEIFSISLEQEWTIIACLMVGKFAIGMTNMMLPIHTAELYPTMIRNLGVGASQFSAGLALICIPYLWRLTALSPRLPMVTIAALCVLGGSVVLVLPDTANKKTKAPATSENDLKKRSLDDGSSPSSNGTFTITDDRGH